MARVFVKGFKKQYPEALLHMLFRPFGEVRSIQTNGLTAVVDYHAMEDAAKAISSLQNRALADTSVLSLDLFYNSRKRIAVRNEFPVATVQAILNRRGRIYNIKETPAYIFVDFHDENDVKKILASRIEVSDGPDGKSPPQCGGSTVAGQGGEEGGAGRHLKITRVDNRPVGSDQTVFVYNVPPGFNENDMLQLFARYGDIVSSGVENDRGFVNYTRPVSALRAFRHLDGKKIKNRRLRLRIKGR